MGIILISVSYLTAIAFFSLPKTGKETFRAAFLKASIVHGLAICIATELLSINQKLHTTSIYLLWSLFAVLGSCLLIRKFLATGVKINFSQIFIFLRNSFWNLSLINKIIFSSIIAVSILSLIISLSAPPNNYDSMAYHMPRVMHWIQNQDIRHYPTHILRQVSFPPGVGYIVLHLQLLAGGDYLANIVQWLAFVGCLLGLSLIAKKIIGDEAQFFAAFICASLPMAIMQSATTQTDLTVSFWLVCFAYFIFQNEYDLSHNFFWLAASLGLAVLAKPTGIIYGVPLLAILGYRTLRATFDNRWSSAVLYSALYTGLVSTLAATLSLPSFLRNFETFGNLFGPDNSILVTQRGLPVFFSNLLRNVALNIPVESIWDLIQKIHQSLLGIDINNPVSTFSRCPFDQRYLIPLITPDENFVGSMIHLALISAACIGLLVIVLQRREKNLDALIQLVVACLIGFGLYCLFIKWQIWGNRLMLPLFILSAPVVAFFIVRFFPNSLQLSLSIILALVALFYSLTPIHRPIIPLRSKHILFSLPHSIFRLNRDEIYFGIYAKEFRSVYNPLAAAALKKNCRNIGLEIGNNEMEYPIWMALKLKGVDPLKIKHIKVHNQTRNAVPEFQNSELCLVLKKHGDYFEIWANGR